MSSADPIPSSSDSNRWAGVERPYGPEDVEKLRGSVQVEHTLARSGAEKLWRLLHDGDFLAEVRITELPTPLRAGSFEDVSEVSNGSTSF